MSNRQLNRCGQSGRPLRAQSLNNSMRADWKSFTDAVSTTEFGNKLYTPINPKKDWRPIRRRSASGMGSNGRTEFRSERDDRRKSLVSKRAQFQKWRGGCRIAARCKTPSIAMSLLVSRGGKLKQSNASSNDTLIWRKKLRNTRFKGVRTVSQAW